MTNFIGKKWSPTITGGQSANVFWVADIEITSMPVMIGESNLNQYAIFQNGNTILYMNVDYLIWN